MRRERSQSIEVLGSPPSRPGAVDEQPRRRGARDTSSTLGEQHRLRMLPVLKKPFETSAIQNISPQKLGNPAGRGEVRLAEALTNNWVEFWYQPKIDLRKKQLAGAEAFARVRHPQHGIVRRAVLCPAPTSQPAGARRACAVGCAQGRAQSSTARGQPEDRRIISTAALTELPVADIVRAHRPAAEDWPGMIFDLTEEQIVSEIGLAQPRLTGMLRRAQRQACDRPFRQSLRHADAAARPAIRRDEARPLVRGRLRRGQGPTAPICKKVIDLAHSFGSLAVGHRHGHGVGRSWP